MTIDEAIELLENCEYLTNRKQSGWKNNQMNYTETERDVNDRNNIRTRKTN